MFIGIHARPIHSAQQIIGAEMKIEFKDITPVPPKREVVITLSVADAKELHNQLYALMPASPVRYPVLLALMQELTASRIQCC